MARCAIVMLAAVFGLAIGDGARPWKRRQIEFFELERRQLESRLDATRAGATAAINELEARVAAQEALLDGRRDEAGELEADLNRFRGKLRAAEQRRSQADLERRLAWWRLGVTPDSAPVLEQPAGELRLARMEAESLGELIADREAKLAAMRSELNAARASLAREQAPIKDLERRLAQLPARPILPMGGLLAPGVAVREISLAAGRVERCVTCHLAAARDDIETDGWQAPFRRHPSPELFLGDDSPHPYRRFGCTTCHGGDGRSTDFARAGHLPVTLEQARAWQEPRGWRPSRAAMLPLDLTEAACGRCHGREVFVPRAQTFDRGRQLIVALGCTGCHPSDHPSLRALPKAGPSLIGIAGKTTPAWAHRWLEAPRALRAATRMPHVFDPAESVAIRAVVDYLWQVSRPPSARGEATGEADRPPPAGEVEAGRTLFESVGCRACHLLGPESGTAAPWEQTRGPQLAGTGSKVAAAWLYAWLREPRAYRRDTPMPSLRLDPREAADLTAFLMTRRDPGWENLSLPATDAKARDRLVLAALARSDSLEQSQARLERMSERDRNTYLGEQTIARLGCHGCHEIAGFEQAPAVGPSLSEVGRRLGSSLGWPDDAGQGGRWQTSHRPAYRLSAGDARAVTTAVLGLAGEDVAVATPALEDDRTLALAEGRRVLERYNCRGCHPIEGRGGLVGTEVQTPRPRAAAAPDRAPRNLAPPDLADAGARLQAPWLYAYLTDPGAHTLRPWLEVRMPTFGLSDAENNALVRYFALRDGQLLFDPAPSPGTETSIAVGRVVFGMLQCWDCHRPPVAESGLPQSAPAYDHAAQRLRPDWVVALILDPERWLPGTGMPANFLQADGGQPGSGFLVGSIETPIFTVERESLLRLVDSRQELHAYLSDPHRVAAALADYLWTLGG